MRRTAVHRLFANTAWKEFWQERTTYVNVTSNESSRIEHIDQTYTSDALHNLPTWCPVLIHVHQSDLIYFVSHFHMYQPDYIYKSAVAAPFAVVSLTVVVPQESSEDNVKRSDGVVEFSLHVHAHVVLA
jgi:hypothetical protein